MEETIVLADVSKEYGSFKAVDRLSLSIRRGEIFGLLGPNGAGKSTTILMMLGLTEPTGGSIRVCGHDPRTEPLQVKRKVGYLPDDVGFYDDRTGMENLLFTARLNGLPAEKARERAEHLLSQVGMEQHAHKRAGTYSRGMRQRLGLADVLMKEPEVIILDEPTLGLDPEGVREFLLLIQRLSREQGITVLLSSHHLHQVQQICDRVGLFVAGSLLAVGTMSELSAKLFADEPVVIEADVFPASDQLLEKVGSLDAVTHVERAHTGELVMTCRSDAAADIARLVVESGASLQRLSTKTYGLDEIYHRYFEGGQKHA